MEVHHHPHHTGHKRKWTDYLLEFFMLFFAVFLGFVAESIREHYTERSKEKEYIHSLISDLKTDTTNIGGGISRVFMQLKKMDTLQSFLYTKDDSLIKKLYKLGFYVAGDFSIKFDQRTTGQLMSSGNMRLIKPNVSDSIVAYNEIIKVMDVQAKLYLDAIMKCISLRYDVYDISYLRVQTKGDTTFTLKNTDWENMHLATTDIKVLAKFDASIEVTKTLAASYVTMLQIMKIKATDLITFLKKEYHIEKE